MRLRTFVIAASVVLVAACTASPPPTPAPTVDDRGGVPPGYLLDIDVVAPLVISAATPDPIPVTGTDGKVHVVYELEVLNFSPRVATITAVETLAGGPDGTVVGTMDRAEVRANSLVLAGFGEKATGIPVGRTAMVLLDDVFATRDDVPATLTHRLTASFGAPGSAQMAAIAARYPSTVTQIGGAVQVSDGTPVVIGPPLAGGNWGAGNGCCGLTSHRGAIQPLAGRINAAERFAIDWVRFDTTADPVRTYRGDISENRDYLAYGAEVLAVADATVVSVVSTLRDEPPQIAPTTLGLEQLGGNYVILDIGGGAYVFLAHLIPGSATVRPGDRVTRGQVIGRLGNSGNTTEPHLHVHVSRAPLPLSGDNVPYVIDRFSFSGSVDAAGRYSPGPDAGDRTGQLPLEGAVIDFGTSP